MSMSNVLYFGSAEIPLATSIAGMQSTLKGLFTTAGWQVHYEQVPGTTGILDLLPPAAQAVGDAMFKEVTRLIFTATSIQVQSYPFCYATGKGQTRIVWSGSYPNTSAGAVAHSLTINGVTVSGAVGSTSSTANDNHRSLFNALRASTDPTITDWNFYYFQADANAAAPVDCIICVRKTVTATQQTFAAGNCTTSLINTAGKYATPFIPVMTPGDLPPVGFVSGASTPTPFAIPVDLSSGWVYVLSVLDRTFYLASRTVNGRYGPIVSTYANHADALAAVPPSKFASIIENFTAILDGSVSGQASGSVWLRPAKMWGVSNQAYDEPNASPSTGYSNAVMLHPFLAAGFPYEPFDAAMNLYSGFNYLIPATAYGMSGAQAATWAGKDIVVPLGIRDGGWVPSGAGSGADTASNLSAVASAPYIGFPSVATASFFTPAFDLPDLWHGLTTAPDETAHLVGLEDGSTTTTTDIDDSTTPSSLTFTDLSAWPAADAYFVIHREPWHYTTRSGNTVSGLTRALYGRPMVKSMAGDKVRPGQFFVKFNNAAIPAGIHPPA